MGDEIPQETLRQERSAVCKMSHWTNSSNDPEDIEKTGTCPEGTTCKCPRGNARQTVRDIRVADHDEHMLYVPSGASLSASVTAQNKLGKLVESFLVPQIAMLGASSILTKKIARPEVRRRLSYISEQARRWTLTTRGSDCQVAGSRISSRVATAGQAMMIVERPSTPTKARTVYYSYMREQIADARTEILKVKGKCTGWYRMLDHLDKIETIFALEGLLPFLPAVFFAAAKGLAHSPSLFRTIAAGVGAGLARHSCEDTLDCWPEHPRRRASGVSSTKACRLPATTESGGSPVWFLPPPMLQLKRVWHGCVLTACTLADKVEEKVGFGPPATSQRPRDIASNVYNCQPLQFKDMVGSQKSSFLEALKKTGVEQEYELPTLEKVE